MQEKPQPPIIFNRPLWKTRRARSAAMFMDHDFLHKRAMLDIVDRLETVMRDFPLAVFMGTGHLTQHLTKECGVKTIIHGDITPNRLDLQTFQSCSQHIPAHPQKFAKQPATISPPATMPLVFDEENQPFAAGKLDLIVSLLSLHTVNDIVGSLIQYRRALKPDGLFLAAIFSGKTLEGLRAVFYQAESEIMGGVTPRIYPFADIKQIGSAMSRAGFALPVTDKDSVKVRYENPMNLFKDLRGMGETNALTGPTSPLSRKILMRAIDLLTTHHNHIEFEITYLTGWAPHPDQQKPLKPGSAKMSLAQAIALQKD